MDQSQKVAEMLEQLLRAHFQDNPQFLNIFEEIDASATQTGVLVHVSYSDGRWSNSTFVGDCDVDDVDDMMALLLLELTQNCLEVFERTGGPQLTDPQRQDCGPADAFQPTFHVREPAEIIWEHPWVPEGPPPTLRLPKTSM